MTTSGSLWTAVICCTFFAFVNAQVVGRACSQSSDCGNFAFCGNAKTCECLPNYAEVNSYCEPNTTVNENRVDCSSNVECSARWPGAFCYGNNPSSSYNNGVCRCVNNQYPIRNSDNRLVCDADGSEAYCANGRPLKTGDGFTDGKCSSSSGCPSNYECTTTTTTTSNRQVRVCCPTRQKSCTDSLELGAPCALTTATITRYWYNQVTGVCQQFYYSGCQGNGNNFATYDDCASYCSAFAGTIRKPTCPQGAPAADSSGNYIDCGVDGVANDAICPSYGLNYRCTFNGVAYGCCATQAYNCMVPADRGTVCGSSSSVTRWYYDPSTASCQTFRYDGCDGNGNNFPSQLTCIQSCGGLCPNGDASYINPATSMPMTCTTYPSTSSSPCPINYVCQPRVNNGVESTQGTCCGGTSNPCGAGYTTVQLSGSAVLCHPTNANVCPTNAICRAPPGQTDSYYCCTPDDVSAIPYVPGSTSSCPPTTTLQMVNGNEVSRCSPNQNTCGPNTLCSYITTYNGYVCCVGTPLNADIPPTSLPNPSSIPSASPGRDCLSGQLYIYPGTTLPLMCTSTGPACPTGYSCQTRPSGSGMICCSVGSAAPPIAASVAASVPASNACPTGTPYAYLGGPLSLSCTHGSTPCPIGYQCVASPINQQKFICCSV